MNFPYSYVSCPCTDVSVSVKEQSASETNEDEEERSFDPRSPRTCYSLYPLEHLMYCEDCQELRCPRCTVEEIVCWYCPGCLFEIPSSQLKSDGNRCQRNCFNCPVCTAPITVNPTAFLDTGRPIAPYILNCGYCNWTSKEIGILFDKVTRMAAQLDGLYERKIRESQEKSTQSGETQELSNVENLDTVYANLKSFLKTQLNDANPENPLLTPSGDINYSSPTSLARIMSLYTSLGGYGKKAAPKSIIMRASSSLEEGLRLTSTASDNHAINKLRTEGYPGTTTPAQRSSQDHTPCDFTSDLRSIPMLLRTKRAKRCRTCRHILVKPEPKIDSIRYRIRLLARNYIPSVNIKPLHASPSQSPVDLDNIRPLQTSQFLLSLRNPVFDPVTVTLATSTLTPGQWGHRVTILCPQFDIGANADAWDEALDTTNPSQQKAGAPSTKRFGDPRFEYVGQDGKLAEAGKVWEKGRNWTSVVVEVGVVDVYADGGGEWGEEDEDVLEIPVFVRVEWEAEIEEKGKEVVKEKRELAYWVVLGVGRIGRVGDGEAS